jgi:hypothetical protein
MLGAAVGESHTDGAKSINNDSCVCINFFTDSLLLLMHVCMFDTMVSHKDSLHYLTLDLNETSDLTKYTAFVTFSG